MNENKDYVSYEVAMKLKEKGYDEDCHYVYNIGYEEDFHRLGQELSGYYFSCNSSLMHEVTAPSLYDAQKWLRKKHKIDVLITFDLEEGTMQPLGYSFDIWQKQKEFKSFCMNFTTYEAALNEGIKRALKYI